MGNRRNGQRLLPPYGRPRLRRCRPYSIKRLTTGEITRENDPSFRSIVQPDRADPFSYDARMPRRRKERNAGSTTAPPVASKSPAPAAARPRWRLPLTLAIVAVGTALAHWPVLSAQAILFDDTNYLFD